MTNGHSLILHCQATGFPQPTVMWQKDGHPIDTRHVTLLSNGSLYISSTVTQDAGKFICSASNIVGSATVSAVIVIYGGYAVTWSFDVCVKSTIYIKEQLKQDFQILDEI